MNHDVWGRHEPTPKGEKGRWVLYSRSMVTYGKPRHGRTEEHVQEWRRVRGGSAWGIMLMGMPEEGHGREKRRAECPRNAHYIDCPMVEQVWVPHQKAGRVHRWNLSGTTVMV